MNAVANTKYYTRTQCYFWVVRTWYRHWPFRRGRYLPMRLECHAKPFVPVVATLERHVRLMLDPDCSMERTMLEYGSWELDVWAMMERHLKPGGVFVDVGAHIGYHSLKAAKVVGQSGRVVAVEPNPETLRKLRENIECNRAKNITVAPWACAELESITEFYVSPRANTGKASLSKVNASTSGPSVGSYPVRTRTLDDILTEAGISWVDVLKIDVEGAELLALRGARDTIMRHHPAVFIELVDSQLDAMGSSAAEVVSLFGEMGYAMLAKTGHDAAFGPATGVINEGAGGVGLL